MSLERDAATITTPDYSNMNDGLLLKVDNVTKHFPIKKPLAARFKRGYEQKVVHAVDNVSFEVKRGEIVGLVGESGSGKTTTGRMISLLEKQTNGEIFFEGRAISNFSPVEVKEFHRQVQIVFQNPYESLDPKFTVFELLEEPLLAHRIGKSKLQRSEIVKETMIRVGVSLEFLNSYPNKLSGGQRQRIALGRSFLLKPKLLIADEPVSMLDASVRASILNIILDLRRQVGTSIILITHDIATARHVCDRICVMYLGRIVEIAPTDELVRIPLHPYTHALLLAIPRPDPDKSVSIELTGEIGNSIEPPVACRLHPRCPYARERCRLENPVLREVLPGHYAACHFSEELFLKG